MKTTSFYYITFAVGKWLAPRVDQHSKLYIKSFPIAYNVAIDDTSAEINFEKLTQKSEISALIDLRNLQRDQKIGESY